ncbi:MAG: VWA domain-containing protein [Planctomycetales bacterium]|nr:VWA domain-containing protein [Planctomycetales bacterium]
MSTPFWTTCAAAGSLASEVASDAASKVTYRFAKLHDHADERWFIPTIVIVSLLVVVLVAYIYRRDSVELRPGVGVLLFVLRLVAFSAALFFFLGLEKRTEKELVHNSRVLLLADTSQSMGLTDSDSSTAAGAPSRLALVAGELQQGDLIEQLRRVHDVVVTRFDKDLGQITSLKKVAAAPVEPNEDDLPEAQPEPPPNWNELLVPQGSESQLGTALSRLIDEYRAAPLAGIIVFTDGANNAGIEPRSAVEAAIEAGIPVFPVGIGSNQVPKNVKVADLIAPSRAFPGDAFLVTGYLQAKEMAGRTVTVELYSRDAADKEGPGVLEDSQRVALGDDSAVVAAKFELAAEETGRRTFRLQIDAPADDLRRNDNFQEVEVEIIDRESRVLLLASAATREYQFLRNQLRRDEGFDVDVLLQSSPVGISQDADQILAEFPTSKEELFAYDAIVAFDADWTALDVAQVDLLEAWVAEQAGGLIVVAGPVHTDRWVRDDGLGKIRALYPVEFNRRLSLLNDAEYGSQTPWPIEFSQAGLEAEFLWIEDTNEESQSAWARFPGVYGYYSVKGEKPGATVYGRFSDPSAGISAERPVYLAGHFYGSGRVFYMGSGEMWRLRAQDEAHFEKFYTKLIRHVSQGRLLRGSSRGVLMTERDRYVLGDTIIVRAQLSDVQHEPLEAESVDALVLLPDGTTTNLSLLRDSARKGLFSGQFTALQEGAFRIDLSVPDSLGDVLSRRIQTRVPDRESENPRRNDTLLGEIAQRSGGVYYVGLSSIHGSGALPPLAEQLKNRQETTILTGAPDKEFEGEQMQWLLGILCGMLCLEWTIRRLCKLA